jgi:hypothetical protein
MKRVSKHLGVVTLLVLLGAQSAAAAPMDGDHSWRTRVRHLVVSILDQLGVPIP